MFPILAFYIIRGSRNCFESMGLYIIVNDSIHLLRLFLDYEPIRFFLFCTCLLPSYSRECISMQKCVNSIIAILNSWSLLFHKVYTCLLMYWLWSSITVVSAKASNNTLFKRKLKWVIINTNGISYRPPPSVCFHVTVNTQPLSR